MTGTAHREFKTIRALIEATLRAHDLSGEPIHKIGSGHEATCYNFAGDMPEFAPYVLRVVHEEIDAQNIGMRLMHSSSLTPVRHVFNGANIGQPLLQLDKSNWLTIALRQPGTSLERRVGDAFLDRKPAGNDPFRMALALAESRASVMQELLDGAERTGENPFLPIYRLGYELLLRGYTPDFRLNNILLDSANGHFHLSLVDQLNLPLLDQRRSLPELFAEAVNETIVEFSRNAPPSATHYHAVRDDFVALAQAARDQVMAEYAQGHRRDEALVFNPVTGVSAVNIDAPPTELLTVLQAMAQQTGVAAR